MFTPLSNTGYTEREKEMQRRTETESRRDSISSGDKERDRALQGYNEMMIFFKGRGRKRVIEGGRWGDTDTQRNTEGKLRQRGAEAEARIGRGAETISQSSPRNVGVGVLERIL